MMFSSPLPMSGTDSFSQSMGGGKRKTLVFLALFLLLALLRCTTADRLDEDISKSNSFVPTAVEDAEDDSCSRRSCTLTELASKSPLHAAALAGDTEKLRTLLQNHAGNVCQKEACFDINARLASSDTALHLATSRGHTHAVEVMLSLAHAQIDVDAPDMHGVTPLHMAAMRRNLQTVRLLLDAGANPSVQDRTGKSPLYHAIYDGELTERTFSGHRTKVFEMLLKRGADPTAIDASGNTLLHRAAKGGLLSDTSALVESLSALGVLRAMLNARHKVSLQTALHEAAAYGNGRTVAYLLEIGADPGIKDKWGRTAARLARDERNAEIAAMLEAQEALVEAERKRELEDKTEFEYNPSKLKPWLHKGQPGKGNKMMDAINHFIYWYVTKFRQTFRLRRDRTKKQYIKGPRGHTRRMRISATDFWVMVSLGVLISLPGVVVVLLSLYCRRASNPPAQQAIPGTT